MRNSSVLQAVAFSMVAAVAAPTAAHAQGDSLTKMVDATKKDYAQVTEIFKDSVSSGGRLSNTGKAYLSRTAQRITMRRRALAAAMKRGVPASQQGLFKMLTADIDSVNLSLLALITDEKGYSGYIKTGNAELIDRISVWQEGIRQSLDSTARSVALARKVAGPFVLLGTGEVD